MPRQADEGVVAAAAEKIWHLLLSVAVVLALGLLAVASASAGPTSTRLAYGTGEIVPIPASIPHEEGDMVDRRILPNLRWIAERFPIYVADGYSGTLPNGEHAGCDNCHVKNSDHHNGLAVDILPLLPSSKCDENWKGITRLALWAEPVQNEPAPPFRWVGYDGDAGHGCGHHLHLSWNHAVAAEFSIAEWVEVFPVGAQPRKPRQPRPKRPKTPPVPTGVGTPTGPAGGISSVRAGGLAARGD
jgi:hypothetical protein